MTCCPTYSGDPDGVIEIEQGGFTPLLFAAQQGDIDSAKLLVAAGANVNDVAPDGTTALVLAAHSGVVPFVEFLLDKGAEPNAAGAGYTALHAAVLRGNLDLVKALVARGVNPDARLTKGTPSRRDSGDFVFDKVLIGATPFLLAAEWGELSLMRVLAASGADPLAVMKDSTTALIAAVRHGEYERFGGVRKRDGGIDPEDGERRTLDAVKLAIELGADVNAGDHTDSTALHLAAYKNSNTVIQFLVDRGARLDMKNKKGQTPLAIVTMGRKLPTQGGFAIDLVAIETAANRDKVTADLLRQLGAQE
jgi:ankyrin repeat protein